MSEDSRRRARVRWVTLGEAVAIAAVVISGLGLWNGYEERRQNRADKAASATHRAPLALRATPNGDGSVLTITAVEGDQVIQGQSVRLPPGFGLPPATTTSDARIEAGWFAAALKADRKTRALPEQTAGDERLPVLIQTDYLADGQPAQARAYYDVGYALVGHFLRGSAVQLRGLALIGQAPNGDAAANARLASLWAARAGRPKS